MIWEDHSLLLVSLLETFGVTCWKDQAVFCKSRCPLVWLKEITISFSRIFFFKHNIAPLYWSLPPSVLCQRVYTNNGFKRPFSHFFHFGEGIWVENKAWNPDLAFWKQKLFRCEPKTICFWNLATPRLFAFLEKRLFALVFGNEVFSENTSWDDLLFQRERLEKKLEVLYEKNFSLFEHSFLSAWIIMSSLFLMSWILWKSILCILRALFIVLGCLLAWLERTSTGT